MRVQSIQSGSAEDHGSARIRQSSFQRRFLLLQSVRAGFGGRTEDPGLQRTHQIGDGCLHLFHFY